MRTAFLPPIAAALAAAASVIAINPLNKSRARVLGRHGCSPSRMHASLANLVLSTGAASAPTTQGYSLELCNLQGSPSQNDYTARRLQRATARPSASSSATLPPAVPRSTSATSGTRPVRRARTPAASRHDGQWHNSFDVVIAGSNDSSNLSTSQLLEDSDGSVRRVLPAIYGAGVGQYRGEDCCSSRLSYFGTLANKTAGAGRLCRLLHCYIRGRYSRRCFPLFWNF
ncbi:hypothetical protein BJ546DRAFT_522405 [Cryomyces antarcticus]